MMRAQAAHLEPSARRQAMTAIAFVRDEKAADAIVGDRERRESSGLHAQIAALLAELIDRAHEHDALAA